MTALLEVRSVSKQFPGVLANDNISLTVNPGEIVALLGENGAGKSTLVKMIYGLYPPDSGEIYFDGKKVEIQSPKQAIDLGIGMVHQHFQLVPVFSVAENVALGAEKKHLGLYDSRQAENDVAKLSEKYGLVVDPSAKIEDLPVGTQQRVEILKVLYRDAKLLILDEPTAVFTPQKNHEII